MSLLVTGFGPFLDVTDNPSGRIAQTLDGQSLAGGRVAGRVLPVSYDAARTELEAALGELEPRVVLLLGVHRGSSWRLERCAGPRVTSAHPDASGVTAEGRELGDAERSTEVDVDALAELLKGKGFDVEVSEDCGGYVCNSTYYAALASRPDALFIHVPDAGAEGVESGCALAMAALEALATRRDNALVAAVPTPLDWVSDVEARYRIHLLALSGRSEELLPGYRRAEERLRPRLPKLDLAWTTLGEALTAAVAPDVDRAWFATRDAAEEPAIARSVASRRAPSGSPFEALPPGTGRAPPRIIVSGAGRPQPARVPDARAVVCGLDAPLPLVWLAAAALPFAERLAAACPDLPPDARRFAALMLAGTEHVGALPPDAIDATLEAFVVTLLPPQHRGAETVRWLEACRVAGVLPEHPGEYERMCHGIPRRRHDRIHRAWVRGSFKAP